MGFISISSIITLVSKVIESAGSLNNVDDWSGWITGDGNKRDVTVTAVSFTLAGLSLKVKDGETQYELKAVPADAEHTHVYLNGSLVDGAAMVFDPKPSPGDLTRFAFDFRPVPIDGRQARFNMRFDTHVGI